jgi:peptidoglycan/LPS O-acetylase OafA/YrhL
MGIELCRGIAALMVMSYHYMINTLPDLPVGISYLRTGVDLFFVISGYVFSPMLLPDSLGGRFDNSRNTLLSFWIRRFFRIYPLYLLTLVICYFLTPAAPLKMSYFLRHLAFLQTTGSLEEISYFHEATWTLPIEMEFYLLLPLLALLRKRPLLLLALGAATLALSLYANVNTGGVMTLDFWFILSIHLPTILPEFMLGAVLAAAVAHGKARQWSWRSPAALWAFGGGLMLLIGTYYFRFGSSGQGYGVLVHAPWNFFCAAAYVLLMFPLLLSEPMRWPLWLREAALLLGAGSYGIYLFHSVVRRLLLQAGFTAPVFTLLAVPLTIAVALLLYRFYENPLRRLGRNLSKLLLSQGNEVR